MTLMSNPPTTQSISFQSDPSAFIPYESQNRCESPNNPNNKGVLAGRVLGSDDPVNSPLTAIKIIQQTYRRHLQSSLPTMLSHSPDRISGLYNIKPLPHLQPLESREGRRAYLWGARLLTISSTVLGSGNFATVYQGRLGNRDVAIKEGKIPEVKHLMPLLNAQKSNIAMVVPIPIEASSQCEPYQGIAVMPKMGITLKDHLESIKTDLQKQHATRYGDKSQGDESQYDPTPEANQQIQKIYDQVVALDMKLDHFGISHDDLKYSNVFLEGKALTPVLSDFGLITVREALLPPSALR